MQLREYLMFSPDILFYFSYACKSQLCKHFRQHFHGFTNNIMKVNILLFIMLIFHHALQIQSSWIPSFLSILIYFVRRFLEFVQHMSNIVANFDFPVIFCLQNQKVLNSIIPDLLFSELTDFVIDLFLEINFLKVHDNVF